MPVNVSGWDLKVISNDHPEETLIPNKSVIAPIAQLNVIFYPLDNSAMLIFTDSNGGLSIRFLISEIGLRLFNRSL